jgi:hypothetical protein
MPTQFTIYRSQDPGAPQLYGNSGSLVSVLNACLITGYGSKLPAGWIADFTSSVLSGSTYRQPSGSGFFLSVIENSTCASNKAARLIGFESASAYNSGSGQFPVSAQIGGIVALSVRKSTTADATTARPWILFADAYTIYMYVQTGDQAAGFYTCAFYFGDIFSFKGPTDAYRCILVANYPEDTAGLTIQYIDQINQVSVGITGHYMARTYSGGGASINVGKNGCLALAGVSTTATTLGANVAVNMEDNSVYMMPIGVHEVAPAVKRGRLRGQYHLCAPIAAYSDWQQFSGSGAFAGKTFMVVKASYSSGMYCIETSPTVEVN